MCSKHSGSEDTGKVFEIHLPEHSHQLQRRLFDSLFKDRCAKCDLPTYVEIDAPPKIGEPKLKLEFGLACGFWLARRDFAEMLCAEFEGQFELRRIADNACFLIFKNVLTPDDPNYEGRGVYDPFFKSKEVVCSLCGKPFILLWEGFRTFKGKNCIQPRGLYETSVKFGTADVKYPCYYCGEEAAWALRKISRKFKFFRSYFKFAEDEV